MSRRTWAWVRLAAGAAIIGVLLWRLGSGPFLDGIRTIDGRALLFATVIALGTTVCCAWRWSVVVRGLAPAHAAGMPLGAAVASYYRSQFLNTTLPGGVLGDVHRAVHHGREAGDVPRGARAVVWDRVSGQLVQAVLTVLVLLALPSPVRSSVPVVAALVLAALVVAVLGARALVRHGAARWSRMVRTAVADVRAGVLARRAWPVVLLASSLAVVGHVLTFLVAAR